MSYKNTKEKVHFIFVNEKEWDDCYKKSVHDLLRVDNFKLTNVLSLFWPSVSVFIYMSQKLTPYINYKSIKISNSPNYNATTIAVLPI